MNSERITKIISFLETVDSFKSVYRAAYLANHHRHESDAEHAWHTSLFALLLYKEVNFEDVSNPAFKRRDAWITSVDIAHTLKLILIHDLVEIYAGDTFVYDVKGYQDKSKREQAAANKLFSLLPEDLQALMHGWWEEFEAAKTPEAQFAQAMDSLQGFAQNLFGGGRVWQERQVTEAMSRSRNQDAIALDPALAEVFQALYQKAKHENLWATNS